MDAMSQFGIDYRRMEDSGIISPVVSVACQYKGMVHFDDTVQIQVKVVKYNGVRERKSTRLNSSHQKKTRMTSSA